MLAALGATLAPFLGAIPGSMITRKNIGPWYEHIKKPSWRPPNWAFGPVWTCLVTRIFDVDEQQVILQYGGMGYASYLVLRDGGKVLSLSLYSTQLALNWAWTPIFFGSHNVKVGRVSVAQNQHPHKIMSRSPSMRSVSSGLLLLQLVSTSTL